MMRNLLRLLFVAACLWSGTNASAQQRIMVDSIYYYFVSDSTVRVANSPGEKYKGNIVIPEKILYNNITEYTVVDVGNVAFMDCVDLKSVTIPNTVTKISYSAFRGCSNLANVIIGNSVTTIETYAFFGCSSLKSVVIPNSVTKIGSSVFGNSGIETITIGNSVTEIGQFAFTNCTSLKSISIPSSVVTILRDAFKGCTALTDVRFEDGDAAVVGHDNVEGMFKDCPIVSVYAGRYLDSGSHYPPFRGIETIKEVTIGDLVPELWIYAFYGCSSLEKVTIGNSVTEIGTSAFANCTALTDVTIGSSVKIIGNSFDGCTNLKSITIPNSVTEIKNSAFRNCSSLTNIVIPNSVIKIGTNVFRNCSSLTSATIGNSVTEIGAETFWGCSSLSCVTMSCSPEIKDDVFRDCGALTTLYSLSVTPPRIKNSTIFNNEHYKTVTVYVPQEALTAYQSAYIWKNFQNYQSYDPTGLRTAKAENGSGVYYDLRGYRLPSPKRGLNIIDGKKVVVK